MEPGMVRVVGIRVASFLVLAASGAFCQQAKEKAMSNSLPDAPMPQVRFATRLAETSSATHAPAHWEPVRLQNVWWKTSDHTIWTSWDATYKQEPNDSDEFRRELVGLLQHRVNYQPSSENSLIARASSAVLGTFIRRDLSGKTRLNTSYFLGVLTSAVIHTAYRPTWNRPVSAPFSDFGSTVGNDAGMNLLHEFRPGLEQLVKSHTPKFVSRIEASIGHK